MALTPCLDRIGPEGLGQLTTRCPGLRDLGLVRLVHVVPIGSEPAELSR